LWSLAHHLHSFVGAVPTTTIMAGDRPPQGGLPVELRGSWHGAGSHGGL